MPALIIIPFAVFMASIFGHMFLRARVRKLLIDRHPETFLQIERSSFFPDQGLQKFLWRRYRDLNDEELDRAAGYVKLLWAATIVSWLACGAAAFSFGTSG